MCRFVKFSCENCGFKIKTKEKYAGRKGKCPGCGTICTVPGSNEDTVFIFNLDKDLAEIEKKWEDNYEN